MKKPLNLSLEISDKQIQVPSPAPVSVAPEAAERRGPGRPPIPPRDDPRRIAVTVEGDLYQRIAHACIDHRMNRQEFLERAIDLMLRDLSAK